MMMKYDDKEFKNISSDQLDLESSEEKETVKKEGGRKSWAPLTA